MLWPYVDDFYPHKTGTKKFIFLDHILTNFANKQKFYLVKWNKKLKFLFSMTIFWQFWSNVNQRQKNHLKFYLPWSYFDYFRLKVFF